MHITKVFNQTTESDMNSGGVFTYISWESLLPAIKEIVRLRDDEILDGFIVTDEHIKVKLSRKKGRKVKV